jgi:transcriptional regulator GlxA family with amidase domain
MATALLVELLCFVSRYYQNISERNPAAILRLGEVISRLEREYYAPWTLPKIATLASMSPNHLLRIFRAATGFTPLEYLVRLRLRHAAGELTETRKSITEIAADTGFSDSNYFSKRFRNFYGTSPREYRRDPGSAKKTVPAQQ